MKNVKMDWTQERDAELRRLWAAGYPGREIGRRLGCSKNAAIGRAHRLKLPLRVAAISATITRPWTEEEDNRLRQIYGGHLNTTEIAERFGRTASSVRYRAVQLGLVLKRGSAAHRARLSDARRVSPPPGPRVTKTSAAPPSARGGRASFPPPAPDLPGVAPETLQQRRVFSNRQCKAPLGARGELRFCDAPVIENAKGCASPYCLEHYAAFYIGTNKDFGNPAPARWL